MRRFSFFSWLRSVFCSSAFSVRVVWCAVWLRRLAFLGGVVFAVYAGGFAVFLATLPEETQGLNASALVDAQGLVVFTGGTGRIDAALHQLADGFRGPVLISGVHPAVQPREILRSLPVEERLQVELDYEADSTRENVLMTRKWAAEEHLTRVGVVTGYYHIPRSLLLFERLAPELTVQVLPVFPAKVGFRFLWREYHKYLLVLMHVL